MATAKPMTKSQIVTKLAEESEITKKQAAAVLAELATLAYKQAKNGFTIPGIGKIVLVQRKARMGRNPATGETIKIKASKTIGFKAGAELKKAAAAKAKKK